MSDLREYKCPACGGAMEFDSGSQKMNVHFATQKYLLKNSNRNRRKIQRKHAGKLVMEHNGKKMKFLAWQFILVSPVAVKLQQTKQQELRHVRSVEIVLF